MKKVLILFMVLSFGFFSTGLFGQETEKICKWKQYTCPGWFGGTYEACLEIGDGNVCDCGAVTRQCGSNNH